MNISYSRISAYLRCPYNHYLGYIRKLTPKRPSRPLHFGADFHKLLEYRGDKAQIKKELKNISDKFYDMPANWQNDLGENYPQDIETIFRDYLRVYKKHPLPDVTEQRFEIPIFKNGKEDVVFVGVIDGLYYNDDGITVEEHKTFSRKPDYSTLVMNTQKCLYAHAVHVLYGELPKNVMWDYIKSTPANEPIWLEKSQRFSTAKSEQITPYSVLRAASKRGLEKTDVKDLLQLYKPNIQNFFFRVTLDFVPEMVNKVWNDFLRTATEICKYGENNTTMNMTRDCSWCNFYSICYAQMTTNDSDSINYIIEHDFTEQKGGE